MFGYEPGHHPSRGIGAAPCGSGYYQSNGFTFKISPLSIRLGSLGKECRDKHHQRQPNKRQITPPFIYVHIANLLLSYGNYFAQQNSTIKSLPYIMKISSWGLLLLFA
jgi:hypothetical protein